MCHVRQLSDIWTAYHPRAPCDAFPASQGVEKRLNITGILKLSYLRSTRFMDARNQCQCTCQVETLQKGEGPVTSDKPTASVLRLVLPRMSSV